MSEWDRSSTTPDHLSDADYEPANEPDPTALAWNRRHRRQSRRADALVAAAPARSKQTPQEAAQPSGSSAGVPSWAQVRAWAQQSAPAPRRGRAIANARRTMGPPGVVQEWRPSVFHGDYGCLKTLSAQDKQDVFLAEADEYGLERPQGYTVSFHYNASVEHHHFGGGHPMKPWRLMLTKELILAYGLEYTMDLYESRPATLNELALFHDRDYLDFLRNVTPDGFAALEDQRVFGFDNQVDNNDCPVFDGLWDYVSQYSGASLQAAATLVQGQADIAVNWSGGLHHAKRDAASGFCYSNDIVLAIQALLAEFQRVLYIDIDVHHGDGVEKAFESTDRVFTLSYHRHGWDTQNGRLFFPGTGDMHETGPTEATNPGKAMALNIPLQAGIEDAQYLYLFQTVTGAVVSKYQPSAIVLQCGADSLGGDRLGQFNLTIQAHGRCVDMVKRYGKPMVVLGGGGYLPRNVARTWCHETAVCVGAKLHDDLPRHLPHYQAFAGPERGNGLLYPELPLRPGNENTVAIINKLVKQALENLRYLEGAPSVAVDTRGVALSELMQMRAEAERELRDEAEADEREAAEAARKKRERNVGGRGEQRARR